MKTVIINEGDEWKEETFDVPLFLSASGAIVSNINFSSIAFPQRWNYHRNRRHK